MELINRLHDLMVNKEGGPSTVVADLIEYTKTHFGAEEELMERLEYPELAHHRQLHKQLTKSVLGWKADLDAGRPLSTRDVLSFLRDWLTSHIQREDKKIGEFILARARQNAKAPA
jgi:hemerythrin